MRFDQCQKPRPGHTASISDRNFSRRVTFFLVAWESAANVIRLGIGGFLCRSIRTYQITPPSRGFSDVPLHRCLQRHGISRLAAKALICAGGNCRVAIPVVSRVDHRRHSCPSVVSKYTNAPIECAKSTSAVCASSVFDSRYLWPSGRQ